MTQSPASDHGVSHAHAKKKRVGKACDSCRIKKTKCDGKKPCSRCILDNKICVFTEKKKQRDKTHPLGYVELLETRLDILTKSLEKLVELSTPHLGFLQLLLAEHETKRAQAPVVGTSSTNASAASDHKARSSSRVNQELDSNDDLSDYDHSDDEDSNDENDLLSDSAVPINKVVAYLINKELLLSTLPVEWERGALIAANLNAEDLHTLAKLFADHKLNVQDVDDSRIALNKLVKPPSNYTFNSSTQHTSLQLSLTDQVNINSFSLGGYSSSGFMLATSSSNNTSGGTRDTANEHHSDVDSDSNTTSSIAKHTPLQRSSTGNTSIKLEPTSPSGLDGFPKRANSLFLNSANNNSTPVVYGSVSSKSCSKSNSSVASLTTKFENQGLASPTELPQEQGFPIHSSGRGLILRRTSNTQRSNSPHSRIRATGHVHKRSHPPRNDSLKNGVELLTSRGRRRSSLTGPQNFPEHQYNQQNGQAQFIVGSQILNQSDLYENVLSLSPQSSRISKSQLESRYDDYPGSSLDDFSNSFTQLPSQVFKFNPQGCSPASLFDPQNQSSYNNPYASNVNVHNNEIVPISLNPPAPGLLEEEGFDFLSNSPYLA